MRYERGVWVSTLGSHLWGWGTGSQKGRAGGGYENHLPIKIATKYLPNALRKKLRFRRGKTSFLFQTCIFDTICWLGLKFCIKTIS